MRKLFLLISILTLSLATFATTPTITIDGDKSDWAEVPMLSEPGTWPMLKVLPAADATLGTNALVYMVENTEDFDPEWKKYPKAYVDKDYSTETRAFSTEECWQYPAMGVDYMATTGANVSEKWVSFPKGISDDNKVIEIGFPVTYITDLESKFGFAMYYNSGAWYCPSYEGNGVISKNGYLYKARSFTSIPNTLSVANAYTHQSLGDCSSYIDYDIRNHAWSGDTALWAAFPIELTDQGVYDVTANVTSTNSWTFEFWLVNIETNAVVAHIPAPGNRSSSETSYNFGIMDLSRVPTGKYMLKVKNRTCYSTVKLNSVTISYVGGEVQNLSTSTNTTLPINEAWFSGCTRDNDNTYVQYPSSGTSSAWIKWNIATSATKMYDLTVNINTAYAHGFTVAIYEDEKEDPVASITEGSYIDTKGDGLTLALGRVNLAGSKNYVVKVTNAPSGSQAKVTGVTFAPVATTSTALPNTLAFSNAVLSPKAHITDGMLYFNTIGDTDPRGQWAQWEVTTDHDGLFLFTMGVTSTNEQTYKITIKDNGNNELDYYETSPGSGTKTVKHYFALTIGSYFVKVENTRSYSKGHLTSLVVTEPDDVLTIDEAATSNTSWSGKVNDGNSYNVQIIRTIVAGMYNTICLPFDVSSSQCKDIFGSDVQLRTLSSADVEEGDFVLNLNFNSVSDINHGTPHLIKTSRNIVNPVFAGVQFATADPDGTYKTNANFIGNFIAGTITASEDNLFLGANNTLYFPTVNMEILGMRAYFKVHGAPGAPAGMIKRARIVENEQILTDIELVRSQEPILNSQKLIENGQLIIVRDGVRYNALGIKLQ